MFFNQNASQRMEKQAAEKHPAAGDNASSGGREQGDEGGEDRGVAEDMTAQPAVAERSSKSLGRASLRLSVQPWGYLYGLIWPSHTETIHSYLLLSSVTLGLSLRERRAIFAPLGKPGCQFCILSQIFFEAGPRFGLLADSP